ncbi:hypothetical protein Pyn_31465 [Prunus yedoensis var. nudiflora]|uniref:Uncharacterized protein n=1 Tax=Prunus yedoensis var. nudiflora TaxID=2094558 RepID=A0A314ZUZ7_PRUYE|nr:hypothetical protein Pyn_31465 [Prunus yedoensis var. nudiflora]
MVLTVTPILRRSPKGDKGTREREGHLDTKGTNAVVENSFKTLTLVARCLRWRCFVLSFFAGPQRAGGSSMYWNLVGWEPWFSRLPQFLYVRSRALSKLGPKPSPLAAAYSPSPIPSGGRGYLHGPQ